MRALIIYRIENGYLMTEVDEIETILGDTTFVDDPRFGRIMDDWIDSCEEGGE